MDYLAFIVFFIGAILIIFLLFFREVYGILPSKSRRDKFRFSNQYNKKLSEFDNRINQIHKEALRRITLWDYLNIYGDNRSRYYPKDELPEAIPKLAEFLSPSQELKIIWLGHSSLLLNVNGKILLIDPVFSGSASPFSFIAKRFQRPILSLKDLPKIDYILISHDHYDHLDMETIKFFKNTETQFFTPLGVGSYLEGWGIYRSKIIELDWWESYAMNGIDFIATPAQHSSGRGAFHANKTQWASWVIKTKMHSIYFSGDSGYDIHFKEIGEKFGPFDIAFIENGQYNPKWKEIHLLPHETIQASLDLNAKKLFPIHWGMFKLGLHAWNEPIVLTYQLSREHKIPLISPKIGEVVILTDDYISSPWWEMPRKIYKSTSSIDLNHDIEKR